MAAKAAKTFKNGKLLSRKNTYCSSSDVPAKSLLHPHEDREQVNPYQILCCAAADKSILPRKNQNLILTPK
jgi:hypothetical protein